MDDYTGWVVGDSIAENLGFLRQLVNQAMGWERKSGDMFEGDKTTLTHFTRTVSRSDFSSMLIKGEIIHPSKEAKILGIIFDSELRFRSHIAKTAEKGVRAASVLRRMTALPPAVARQLATATVASVYD